MSIPSIYRHSGSFQLENGKHLQHLEIAYQTFGTLNAGKDNVVWVCHALTANSDVFDWWPGLFGADELFNPREHFIVCANILGSAYGTTNPMSIHPTTGLPYYLSFPEVSVRDMVAAHRLLADHLGIGQIHVLIGGSLGGQQALEWGVIEPSRIQHLILIASNAEHSPWGIAFNESQRLAIAADRTFFANHPAGGAKGLKAARSLALLSYRTYETYAATQRDTDPEKLGDFRAASYQNYQGDKLVRRFNAYSYWYLTKAMDSHQVGRGRGGVEAALQRITARTLAIGVHSDVLFPVQEQQRLARQIAGAQYAEIQSMYGHDGFLIETAALSRIIGSFLQKEKRDESRPKHTKTHNI